MFGKGKREMKPNAPKKVTWMIALALVVLALAVKFTGLVSLTVGFWLAVAAAVLLLLATFLTKL